MYFSVLSFYFNGKTTHVFCHMKVDLPSFVAMLITKPWRSLIKTLGFCICLSKKPIKIAFVTHYNYNSHAIIFAFLYYLFWSKTLSAARTFNSSWVCIPPARGRGCSPAALRHGWPSRLSKGTKHISSWLSALLKATKTRHFTHIPSQRPRAAAIGTEFILDISVSLGCPESCCMLQSTHFYCPLLLKIGLKRVCLLPLLLFLREQRSPAR